MLKGVLALLLLRLCAEREDYGYSLVQRLREGGLVDAAEGSVYPALARLESRGLVEPRLVREGRGPGRRYYSVTTAGLSELSRLDASWDAVDAAVRDGRRRAARLGAVVATDDGDGSRPEDTGTAPRPLEEIR